METQTDRFIGLAASPKRLRPHIVDARIIATRVMSETGRWLNKRPKKALCAKETRCAVTPKSRLISKPWLPPVSPSHHKVAQEAEKAQVHTSAISKIATSHPELDGFAAGTGWAELIVTPRLSFFHSI